MRFSVKSTTDVSRRIGDRVFDNKKGEMLELSSQGFETAMSAMMDGAYELVSEIPETDAEKERYAATQKEERERAKLEATPKPALVKRAQKLAIETHGNTKADLVDAIIETQNAGDVGVTMTDATGTAPTAQGDKA